MKKSKNKKKRRAEAEMKAQAAGEGGGEEGGNKDEGGEEEDDRNESQAPLIRIDRPTFQKFKSKILEDVFHHYYVTSDWSPQFYRELAHEGFIAVQNNDEYLLPEIQRSYCVLEWPDLHIGRKTKRLWKQCGGPRGSTPPTGNGKEYSLHLRCNTDWERMLKRVEEYWGKNNWFSRRYAQTLQKSGLNCHTIELWRRRRGGKEEKDDKVKNDEKERKEKEEGKEKEQGKEKEEIEEDQGLTEEELIAGEFGYTIGGVYTSLTGFCDREKIPGCGTLQLCYLGRWLQQCGYAWWNLGHPPSKTSMRYKADLGGKILSRKCFLEKWQSARDLQIQGLPHNAEMTYCDGG